MSRVRTLAARLVATAVLVCSPPLARAQPLPLGIPIAEGVPGNTAPPDWVKGGNSLSKLIDDPRWAGAVGISYGGTGASDPISDFRAIQSGANVDPNANPKVDRYLYLQWFVRTDPQILVGMDRVCFGFAPTTENANVPATLFIVKLAATSTAGQTIPSVDGTYRSVECYTRQKKANSNDFQWTAVGTPAWADVGPTASAAVWIDDPRGRSDPNESLGACWAVNIRVPILKNPANGDVPANGVPCDKDGNLRFWFECQNWFTDPNRSLVHPMPYPLTSFTKTPDAPGDVNAIGVPDPYISDTFNGQTRQWGPIHLKQTGADNTPVSTDGINLTWNKMGVIKNATPPTMANPRPPIPATLATEIGFPKDMNSPDVLNLFVARPTNGTPVTTVNAEGIQARFRIANWGSQIGGAPLPNDPLWKVLPSDNGAKVVNVDPIGPGLDGEIRMYWTAKATDPFVQSFMGANPTRNRHQCVLVELTANGQTLIFLSTGFYKNMNFVEASKFSRTATISVEGLKPLENTTTRDVYLYVRTTGMPAQVGVPGTREPWPTVPPKPPGPKSVPVLPPTPREVPRLEFAELPKGKGDDGGKPVPAPRPDPNPTLPSYTVYAWHETGRTLTVDGVQGVVVEPQNSFGYYVTHNGPLNGWQYALKGAKKIGPDFYKVSPPNNGSVDVVTELEAVETGPVIPAPCVCPPGYVPYVPGYVPYVGPRERRGLLFRRWR